GAGLEILLAAGRKGRSRGSSEEPGRGPEKCGLAAQAGAGTGFGVAGPGGGGDFDARAGGFARECRSLYGARPPGIAPARVQTRAGGPGPLGRSQSEEDGCVL